MKVTLFFGFGHFLVVKMLFVLPEIWAHVWPRRSSRLEPNETRLSLKGSFRSYLAPVKVILSSKKLTCPNKYALHIVGTEWIFCQEPPLILTLTNHDETYKQFS